MACAKQFVVNSYQCYLSILKKGHTLASNILPLNQWLSKIYYIIYVFLFYFHEVKIIVSLCQNFLYS